MAEEVKYKVAEDFKASVKLLSGQEVVIDMMKINAKEWKDIVKPGQTDEDEAAIISRATGVAADKLLSMPQPDYRLIIDSFIRLGTQPLTNPT